MKKITEQEFDRIKKILNTEILVKPSIHQVARQTGYISSTISRINKSKTFDEYKRYQLDHMKRYLDFEIQTISEERERAKKEIEDFNNEWYFGGKK